MNFFRRLKKYTGYNADNHQIDSEALFSLSSAQLTLETGLEFISTGKAAIGLKGVSGRLFRDTINEITHFLDVSKTESGLSYRVVNDSYGYLWITLESGETEDILSGISAVGQTVHDRGFSKQLFAAVFQFSTGLRRNNLYLVYNYALNKFYPFVPVNKNERDSIIERQIMEMLKDEIPFEKDASLWYPIRDLNL